MVEAIIVTDNRNQRGDTDAKEKGESPARKEKNIRNAEAREGW